MLGPETPQNSTEKRSTIDILKIILILLVMYLSIALIISIIGYFGLLTSLSGYLKYVIFNSESPTQDYYFWGVCLSFAGLILVALADIFVIKKCLI